MSRFIEELRPKQILEKIRNPGAVFVPVSPLIEWHSFHLPIGVDGLIAEGVAAALADKFDALCCRCIPMALDGFRSEKEKQAWGLDPQADVFGMNFPNLPLTTENHTPELLAGMVSARLTVLKTSGFRFAFLVNQHGGAGQNEQLAAVAEKFSNETFRVERLCVPKLNTFHEEGERFLHLKVGGHAGLCETLQLMAFRPDLVELDELPEGELSVAQTGILHGEPQIPAEFNPRRAAQDLADKWRESVLTNAATRVRGFFQTLETRS